MIQDEFQEKIGFHDCYHKNKSTIVYNKSAGGSYIESAIYSWGVSDEQLINTIARRLRNKLMAAKCMKWPPTVDELESP